MKRLILILSLLLFGIFAWAYTTYESFLNHSTYLQSSINNTSQTFYTTSTAHTISGIAMWLRKTGSPTSITFSIRATDLITGKPTGSDLTSVINDCTDFTTGGQREEIIFDDEINIDGDTIYAIVIIGGDAENKVGANGYEPGTGYTNGTVYTGSGESWTEQNWDLYFEILGNEITPPEPPAALDYTYILAMILLGIFILVLIDFIRRLAMGI